MRTWPSLVFVAAFSLSGAACSTWSGFGGPHPGQRRERPEIALGDVRLKLHLARPSDGRPTRVLLFHVTGDSGWHGLDPLFFDTMTARGFTLAGASARAFRARLGEAGGSTPARLAADYLSLIDAACERLQLPGGTPVILTGLSRGAGLTVVAAAQPELARRVSGVLLMGLTADEGNVRPTAAPFGLLDRIDLPLVLLQSTSDRHVPAAEARRLFGPDASHRKLVAIEADSHTFSGHRDELFRQVESAIAWIIRETP
jgi:fermentation-respiration switch protein FrsA (DUF1100 family)